MKYVTLAGDRRFEMHDEPMFPVNGSPVIRITHAGLCGTDLRWWQQGGQHLGQVIGHEYSGVIEEPGTSGLKKGDRVAGYTQNVFNEACGHCRFCLSGDFAHCENRRVYTWKGGDITHPGCYSELTTWFPRSLCLLPDTFDQEEGALVEPAAVALHAVMESGVRPGDKCLILGCGTIASITAQWLRIYGAAEIAMTEINPVKIKLAERFGTTDYIVRGDRDNAVQELIDRSCGGFDICFDYTGAASAVNVGLYALKKEFRKTFVGIALPNRHLSLDYDRIVLKQIQFRGSKGHQFPEFCAVIRAVAGGAVSLKRYITRRIPFADIQKGFEEYEAANGADMKAVIEF